MRTGVLIAEADAELREIYERLSAALGIDVATAADGLECWAKLWACSPGVLVVDMGIRWGGGDGVLARLREHSNGAIPALFVTGDDSPQILSSRFGVPIGNCFQKPFSLSRLLESVGAVIAADRHDAAGNN